MLKSTVISILRSFTKEEIIKFDDFLKSPYFNKKSAVPLLFGAIRKHYPELASPELEKEKLWAKLYPGKDYNYGMMKNLIHELTKLAEQFITQEEYRQNEIQEFANLYKAIANRNLKTVLDNKGKNLEKISGDDYIEKINIPIEEYFHMMAKIYETKVWNTHFHALKVSSVEDRYLTEDNFITGMLIHLITINYSTNLFSLDVKNKTDIDNAAAVILESITDGNFEKILGFIRKRSEAKYIILKCYLLAYKAYCKNGKTEDLMRLKDYFYSNSSVMPVLTIRDMDVILVNTFSLMKDFTGDKDKELREVYKFKIKNELILDRNRQINSLQFIPWLVIFFEEEQADDLRLFINHYSKFLIESDKNDSLLLAESIYNILKNDFGNALSLLSRVKFDSFVLKNLIKKLTLLIYYEMQDYELFLQSCDAHNHFLNYAEKENKVERHDNIKRTRELMKSVNSLYILRDNPTKEKIHYIESEVHNLKMDFKKWFLRKIDELKNSSR